MTEQIVFIEFRDGKPFTVLMHDGKGEEIYDVEWCKCYDQLYYHNSGGGPAQFVIPVSMTDDFWIADHLQAVCKNELIEKTMDIPKEFYGSIDDWATESRCEYCTVCDDWFPEYEECQHLYWSDNLGYAGCGCDEDDSHHKPSFFAFLEKTGLSLELKTALKLHSYFVDTDIIKLCGWYFDDRLSVGLTDETEEEISDGIGWLSSLEPGVTLYAEQLTIQWIDEYLLKKREIIFRRRGR